MAVVYIGLGSNMGNRLDYMRRAVREIAVRTGAEIIAETTVMETAAVDFENQPDFLNMIVKIKTDLAPLGLLEILQQIENDLGRIRRFPKGPREIDLDILLYDDLIIKDPVLDIPHPGILFRNFIMRHLLELDPDLADPASQKKYSEVLNHDSNKKYQ